MVSASKPMLKPLRQALAISREIERLEVRKAKLSARLADLLADAGASMVGAPQRGRRRAGSVRELVREVLTEAGRPMALQSIYDGIRAKGYRTTAKKPLNTLAVHLYTDRVFQHVGPGLFFLAGRTPRAKASRQTRSRRG